MILIIDKNEDLCLVLQEVLQEEGHKVDYATSMEVARPLLEKNHYNVIFVDYLSARFQEDFSFVGQGKVVLMTSTAQDAKRFTYVLSKPFNVTTLLNIVESSL